METCILCSAKLTFTNTPTFGAGKLLDGGRLCTKCFSGVNKINPNVAFNTKKHTLSEIQELFAEKTRTTSENSTRLDSIKEEIKNLNLSNTSSFFGRKEINELPNILAVDEKIDNIVQGTYNNGMGILVSTNRRLVFIDKGLLYGLKVEDFPLDKITSIQYETGILMGKIKIHTSGNIAEIDNIEKASTRNFSEFVRNKLSQPTKTTDTNNSQPDILTQIEKLGKLKDSGIITEDEFAEQKKKLLEKL